jgi:hypothetical protein
MRKIQELFSGPPKNGIRMRLHLSRATQGVDHYPGGRARGAGLALTVVSTEYIGLCIACHTLYSILYEQKNPLTGQVNPLIYSKFKLRGRLHRDGTFD